MDDVIADPTYLSCRGEVLEFGQVPICPWLSHISTVEDLLEVKRRFLKIVEGRRTSDVPNDVVTREDVGVVLDCSTDHTHVLLDLLSDVSDVDEVVLRDAERKAVAADLYRLVLFLGVHLYVKNSMKPETADVWPDDSVNSISVNGKQMEPSSPQCLTRSWGREQSSSSSSAGHHRGVHHHSLSSSPTRGHLVEYLQYQEILSQGFSEFLARHTEVFVSIACDSMHGMDEEGGYIRSHEIERLGLLLKPARYRRNLDDMEVCEKRTNGVLEECQEHVTSVSDDEVILEMQEFCDWIRQQIETSSRDIGDERKEDEDVPMMGTSPPTYQTPMFNKLISTPQMNHVPGVYGSHRATILRGEDDCEGENKMRIVDCHDCVVYCLAPLRWVNVSCCTSSIIVLGAVSGCVRVEKCEKLQVISVASHIVVNTCHDCIMYTAVNRPPLMVGDNRFVQLAPYNAGYECLEEHMKICCIERNINVWDKPVLLMPGHPMYLQHRHYTGQRQELDHSLSVGCLAPEKLMPFMIPFKGGKGPLCGGAAPSITRDASNDTLTGLLTQDFVEFVPSPFPLPQRYVDAWKARMEGVNRVRAAYRDAKLSDSQKREFTASVQSSFKEWLQSGGGMREVYDLAKVEKEQRKQHGIS